MAVTSDFWPIARNVIHFSDICYLRTKTNNKSTNCLLWLLEKLLNFIGALKHRLLPQADGQHRIPEKHIASNGAWTKEQAIEHTFQLPDAP